MAGKRLARRTGSNASTSSTSSAVAGPPRAAAAALSNRSSSGWFVGGGAVEGLQAQPGDTVFVPENLFHIGNSAELKDWSTILYQFGLGALALKNLK